MNIFLHELKAYRKSMFIWSFSMIAIIMVFMSLYPSFSKEAEEFTKLLEGFPEPVRKAFGIDLQNFFSILGFYSYVLSFIILTGAIQAMILGTSIISKEVREKTADFLLTKPVTRKNVLTAKLLAAFVSLLVTNIVYDAAAVTISFQVKVEDFSLNSFVLLSITLFFVQLIFLALGTFFSVAVRKMKSVLPVSLATVFSFYFIAMLGGTTEEEIIRYFSPFKYFDSAYIMAHSGYESPYLIVSALIIIIAVTTSYIIYSKKDIHAI